VEFREPRLEQQPRVERRPQILVLIGAEPANAGLDAAREKTPSWDLPFSAAAGRASR
jgi:hypothetical protein